MRSWLPVAMGRVPKTPLIEQIRSLHPPTGAWLDELALAWAECELGALLYGPDHSCPLCRGETHPAPRVP